MIDKKKILEILLPTPRDAQTANVLFALRLVFGVMMFIHGLGKLVNFSMLAETLGSIAVMLGFMTRAAAAIILVNLVVALVAVHGCDIFGAGELAFVYIAVMAVLVYIGAGGKSLDAKLIKHVK